jgi:sporulation protein YlmC with PRC-barrel domain
MAKILAKNLSNKRKPNTFVDISKYKNQANYLLIPFEAVRAAKDYAIVDKKLITGSDFD